MSICDWLAKIPNYGLSNQISQRNYDSPMKLASQIPTPPLISIITSPIGSVTEG